MKIKKRVKVIVLMSTLMGTCFTAGVYADDMIEHVDAYLRKDFNVVVNGDKISLANPPLIYNDSSYLPVKEIGNYLGADVNWEDSTKTIYVNPIIHEEQTDNVNDETYEKIQLKSPVAYTMQYQGGTYPVLMNVTTKMYYRLKDIERMGIDTSGLALARETYTNELYVSDAELKTRLKEKLKYVYSSKEVIVSGETDAKKLQAIRDWVEENREYEVEDEDNEDEMVTIKQTPIIVDALPEENQYAYLFKEDGHFYQTTLKITKITDWNDDPDNPQYVVASYTRINLELSGSK